MKVVIFLRLITNLSPHFENKQQRCFRVLCSQIMINKCVCTIQKIYNIVSFIFGLVGFAADKVVYKWISQDSSEAVEKDSCCVLFLKCCHFSRTLLLLIVFLQQEIYLLYLTSAVLQHNNETCIATMLRILTVRGETSTLFKSMASIYM